jgi:hypothetical protein
VPFIVQKIAGQQSMIAYVPSAVLRIGRGTNAELRLDDVAVALEHAVIEPMERGYRLLDRGSATGTYLNGKPVHEALLSANDLIDIGGYQIRVQITDPEDPLFLSVRAGATVVAPRAGTMAAPPRVIAAAVQAAAAHEAARRAAAQEAVRVMEAQEAAAREAAQAAAPAAQAATAPAAAAPAGPAAWEVTSSESVTAADAATMRMSPEALAAAVRAATAMAAAAGSAGAAAEGRVARASEAGAAPSVPALPPAPGVPAAPDTPAVPTVPAVPAASVPPSPPPSPSPAAAPLPSPPSPPSPSPRAMPQPPSPSLSPPPPSPPPPSPPSPRQPSSAVPALRAPVVDYLGAYSLRRPLLNKGLLALVLTAGAVAALLFLARRGRATAFEPGSVHAWHAETACAACHSPWRGPDPALCSDCHAGQREKGEIHQARQTSTPPCTRCHPEHRGGDGMTAADDTECASCHRDLRVNPPGAEPRFARRVSAFFDDHPDFSITLPSGARLPLPEAVARRADPTPLKFNHLKHLRPGLPTPSGQRVQLGCESCHHLAAGAAGTAAGSPSPPGGGRPATPSGQNAAAGGPTGIVPVAYETSCTTSGCHALTFDPRRPGQVAPHAPEERVKEFVVSVYSDRRGANESVGDQYRRLIRGAGAAAREIDYGGQAQGAVVLAERYLFGTVCKECHIVDLKARPLPKVTPTSIPARWLPNGWFQHSHHRTSDCQLCHGAAAASTVAADVLLPSIAVCRTCHGGASGAQVKAGSAPAAPTGCLSCHRYHPDSPNPAQAALAPPARALPPAPAARAAAVRPRLESAGSGI